MKDVKTSSALKELIHKFKDSAHLKGFFEEEKKETDFDISAALQAAREEAQISETQLAKEIGTTTQIIIAVENDSCVVKNVDVEQKS